jgi:hypothetical protein
MQLTQVPLPPETYYHRLKREDGSVFEIEITQEEYDALALPNCVNPENPDGVWFQSYKGYKLEQGTYCDEKGVQVLVNTDGNTIPLAKEFMVGDILKPEGLVEITRLRSL